MAFQRLLPDYKQRNRSCHGKIRHQIRLKAFAHKSDLEAQGKTRGGELIAYFCSHCHGWHVGHVPRAALPYP